MESIQQRKMGDQVMDKIKEVTATCTLGVNDRIATVTNPAAAVVITLPQVDLAAGKIYEIRNISDTGGFGIDVIAGGDARFNITEVSAGVTIDLGSAVAIDTAGDFLLVMSTGLSWVVLAYSIT